MIFTTLSLAARVEAAERSFTEAWTNAVGRLQPAVDTFTVELAGGIACYAGPGSPLNKICGMGFHGAPPESDLSGVERRFFERNCPVQVEVAHLADPEVGKQLVRRGYMIGGFENVLGKCLRDEASIHEIDGIEVRTCSPADLLSWVNLLVEGILAPDTDGLASHEAFDRVGLETPLRAIVSVPGWVGYAAYLDEEMVGAGSMRVYEGVCHLCGAATLSAHRRRGVQTALLNARLRDAARSGCDLAVVTTQPGSKSHQNVQRRGFEILYTRAVFTKS
ncbi:MAG: GNAT family N-acetyltransferase [Planctomycetes bacterium]|nr:GNAT family N-acetyltransferase [Planctomycetota bacterium]